VKARDPRRRIAFFLSLAGICVSAAGGVPEAAPGAAAPPAGCDQRPVGSIPVRATAAPAGHEFAQRIRDLSGIARDAFIRSELLAGNIPQFLRHLVPVSITRTEAAQRVELTVCVLPDYLAVGSDHDFVFVPMGLEAALEVAGRFGFGLPTPELVDAIYRESTVRLAPLPLPPGEQMRSTAYFVYHNDLIAQQRSALGAAVGELTAGHKKDLVLSSRLWLMPGRVAIYGWHREFDEPIQPLSLVHGARYADYSHGVRLVSNAVYVNGVRRTMQSVLADSSLAHLLTDEGPWPQLTERLAALSARLRELPAAQ